MAAEPGHGARVRDTAVYYLFDHCRSLTDEHNAWTRTPGVSQSIGMKQYLVSLGAAACLVLAACGGSSNDASEQPDTATVGTDAPVATAAAITEPAVTEPSESEPAVAEPAATEPVATEPTVTDAVVVASVGLVGEWDVSDPDGDCVCADGSEFVLWERPADPKKVVLYFEGGGACFTEESCDFENGTYTSSIDITEPPTDSGLFDATNPENPLANHSIVYVPYCTGDVFLGDETTTYGDLEVRHNGFVNASAGLDLLLANYPDAEQVVVTGASAGSVPTPLFAGLASDRYPDTTDIVTFGDSSGGYPDASVINATIGSLWGTTNNLPAWPVAEGLTAEEFSIPGLYVLAGTHAPEVRYARFDYAFDQTQAFFGSLSGVPADELVALIDATEALGETSGIEISAYVAPGSAHTIMRSAEVYELEVEGARLIDWLTELFGGTSPADVHCVDCAG
jgi:hypothetical protein